MVCNVIDECRCYQLKGNTNQFCGVRRGERVVRCPDDCCFGGCVSDGSREPFRIINFNDSSSSSIVKEPDPVQAYDHILLIFIVFCIIMIIYLKIRGLRKV